MINENTKLEHGGKVRISGLWHGVFCIGTAAPEIIIGLAYVNAGHLKGVIEAYEPPAPPPYDWSTGCATFGDDINAALTARHGDPTIRTYAGEDPAQYGLTMEHRVLAWHPDGIGWVKTNLEILEHGTQWRKQLPAPQEVTV